MLPRSPRKSKSATCFEDASATSFISGTTRVVFDEYTSYDGVGLAALVAKGEVSPKEVIEAAIMRAEAVNPKLNAIVSPLYDYAHERTTANRAKGPLAQVPFLLKDVHHALQGTPMSNGSVLHKGEFVLDQCRDRESLAGCGPRRFRQDQHPRIQTLTDDQPRGVGSNPQPLRRDSHSGWVQWGVGRGCSGGDRTLGLGH